MKNTPKQSSIEWLVVELNQELNYIPITQWDRIRDLVQRAKAMHKEEIKNAQMDMFIHLNNLPYGLEYLEKRQSAEDFSQQYYEQTFGGNNE